MAASTSTTFDPVIRELWPQRRINELIFQDRPFMARVKKKTDFTEKKRHIALRYNAGQGAAESFSVAKTNASSSQYEDFVLTISSEHYYGTLDGLLLERTKDDRAALVNALDDETEGSLETLAGILNADLFRDGSGSLGIISNSTPTTTVTLTDVNDVVNFHKDMVLVAATSATASVRSDSSKNTAKIKAVDRDAGKLTLTTNVSTAFTSSWAKSDHLFRHGDAQDGASSPSRLVGLDGWLPSSAPGTTAFFSVDRSQDTTKLGGVRYDGSSDGSIEEALIKAAQRMKREGSGAKPTDIYMNPSDMGSLIIELGNRLERDDNVAVQGADVGIRAINLRTPAGDMKVFQDAQCPSGVAYMLRIDTWTLHSLGPAPRPWSMDGLNTLRLSGSDGVEHRSIFRAQLGCDAPGWNCRITLPA